MVLRLLPKKEIDKQKAAQRQAEIDEGLKLTRRVDSLRELVAEEDAKLEAHRKKMVAAIQDEIEPLDQKRGELKKEVSELERTREKLLIPLDDEWAKVNKEKEKLAKEREELDQSRNNIRTEKQESIKMMKNAQAVKLHTESLEIEAENIYKDAILKAKEAGEMMHKAEVERKNTEAYVQSQKAYITEEHRKLDLRTKALEEKETQVAVELEEIRVAKLRLEDRRATLERALKRKS